MREVSILSTSLNGRMVQEGTYDVYRRYVDSKAAANVTMSSMSVVIYEEQQRRLARLGLYDVASSPGTVALCVV